MRNRATRVGREESLLDLRIFARPGPAGRVRFSPAQLEQIVRTASRTPEVVVKVSRGATSTAGVIAHLRYIDRNGRLEIESDGGDHLKGKGIEKDLTDDWDLDSANAQGRGPYRGKAGRKPARLVHNIILSMPNGKPHCESGGDSSHNTCAPMGSLPTRPSAQCGARPGRASRMASIAHRSGAIPAICGSAYSASPASSVTEASSQTPEGRSSSKPGAM